MLKKLTPALIRALAMFVITLVVSVVVVSISYVYTEDAYSDQHSAKRAMRIWQSKINNSVENKKAQIRQKR